MAVCFGKFPFLLTFRYVNGTKMLRESSEYCFLESKRNSSFFPIQCLTKKECYNRRNVVKCKICWRRNIQILIHKRLISSYRKKCFLYSQYTHCTSYQTRNMCDIKNRAVSSENVTSILQKCSSVQEQMEELCRTVSLTSEDLANRAKICSDLENVLRPYFPNCNAYLVGSSANGFGLRGCDIDITLDTNCGFQEEEANQNNARFPSVDALRSGQVPLQTLHDLPLRMQLCFIRHVLECLPDFHCPKYISGRCPIVKFLYGQDGLNCDLSINNRTGFRSTKLLDFCGKLDRRVLLLQTTLSYWAKRVDLIGGIYKFKSYALSLLLVYFLQTRNPPVLPTLEYIFSKSKFFQNEFNWDYQVGKDVQKLQPSKNTQSADDLLREFFLFYFYFDFKQVISPLTGSSRSFSSTADPSVKQFNINSICLEDPLQVSWNVTRGVDYGICKIFQKRLHVACKLYENKKYWCPGEEIWGIAQLFDQDTFQRSLRECKNSISINVILKPETRDILAEELGVSKNSMNLKDIWLHRSSQTVRKIFEHGFLFKCSEPMESEKQSVIASEHLSKKSRAIGNSFGNNSLDAEEHYSQVNVHEESQHSDVSGKKLYLHMQCIAHNTWQRRIDYRRKFQSCLTSKSLLEKENFLSLRMSQTNLSSEVKKFEFCCECEESEVNGLPLLLIKLEPLENANFPPKLAVFLNEYVPRVVSSLI